MTDDRNTVAELWHKLRGTYDIDDWQAAILIEFMAATRESAKATLIDEVDALRKALQRALNHIAYMHNFGRHRIIAAVEGALDEFMKSTSAVTGNGKSVLDELRAALAGGAKP